MPGGVILPLLWLVLLFNCATCQSESFLVQLVRSARQSGCSKNQFTCSNGMCIDQYQVCDGAKNCLDGTDETQAICTKLGLQCPSFAFRCAYGACVDKSAKCDGKRDCADNSDELLPECLTVEKPSRSSKCKKNEFPCYSGQCINEFAVCDGVRDCNDGTDETITQCVNIRCPSFTFQCAYGACIEMGKKCNGVKDCSDGSDEDEELCEYSTNALAEPRPQAPPPKEPPINSFEPQPSGGCRLPSKTEGSRYKKEGCQANDRSDKCLGVPGTWVENLAVLSYSCDRGYSLQQSTNNNMVCINGNWNPPELQCRRMCKPLFSESLEMNCALNGQPVPCNLPAKPGTKVRPKCKSAYHAQDPSTTFKETECTQEGVWESPLFKCVAECGKPSFHTGKPLITLGTVAVTGEYPWHVGLYRRTDGIFNHTCGGTIISPHIVLTAAHCIYIEATLRVMNANDLVVAAGKFNRSWEIKDPAEQRIAVKDIISQTAYRGQSNSYEQDIAVLDLVNSIELSSIVLPACIDWTSEGMFINGMIGTVVGWGMDEHGKFSEKLKAGKLSYLDYDTCRSRSPNGFLRYITYDKFCAGADSGTSVQQGDSGGGITFVRNNLHFVYGIVSVKPMNYDTFAAFTSVNEHIDWLHKVVNALKHGHVS